MATLSAARFNPIIRETYQRLLACARKLLINLNSLAAEQIRTAQQNQTMLPGEKPAGA